MLISLPPPEKLPKSPSFTKTNPRWGSPTFTQEAGLSYGNMPIGITEKVKILKLNFITPLQKGHCTDLGSFDDQNFITITIVCLSSTSEEKKRSTKTYCSLGSSPWGPLRVVPLPSSCVDGETKRCKFPPLPIDRTSGRTNSLMISN